MAGTRYGDEEVGRRIALARADHGMSQEGLGSLMRPRRSQDLVSGWETGARDPSTHDLKEIARITGKPLAWLIGDPIGDFGLDFSESWSSLSPALRDEVARYVQFLAQRAEADERATAARDGITDDESDRPQGTRKSVRRQSRKSR